MHSSFDRSTSVRTAGVRGSEAELATRPLGRRLMRRAARTGGGDRRPRESQQFFLAMPVGPVGDQACPSPARDAFDSCGTSRQPNTHNTESREVCYPWHPWFGRSVAVYEVLVKCGRSVYRCGFEEERTRRSVEIPTWMFEPAACCRLRVMAVPSVGCDALLELKALLRTAAGPDSGGVLQAQHRSLLTAGGADATVRQSTTTRATHTLSSSAPAAVVSAAPLGDSSRDDQFAGGAAPRPRQPRGGLRRRRTGGA